MRPEDGTPTAADGARENAAAAANGTTLGDRLRAGTRAAHDSIEQTAYSGALMSGRLPRAAFAGQVRALEALHTSLEAHLNRSDDPAVAIVWRTDLAKAAIARSDADHLGAPPHDALDATTRSAIDACIGFFDRLAARTPWALIGPLYVLEGSTMGGAMIARQVAPFYDLDPDGPGLRLLRPYGNAVREHWTTVRARIDDAGTRLSADQLEDVVHAASEMFTRLEAIHRTIGTDG